MQLIVTLGGEIRCVYGETIDLAQLGSLAIRRGSHVEPNSMGQWCADLRPVNGPTLGPFASRSQALAAEEVWLAANWLAAAAKNGPLAN
jgi:hypothetical protein